MYLPRIKQLEQTGGGETTQLALHTERRSPGPRRSTVNEEWHQHALFLHSGSIHSYVIRRKERQSIAMRLDMLHSLVKNRRPCTINVNIDSPYHQYSWTRILSDGNSLQFT